ncbi:MAG: mandelate racemase/muconate lactonizing enzyme family protein, partial [Alphaproteobacteria bacterium]
EYILLVLILDNGMEGIAEAVCRPEFSGEDSQTLAYVVEAFFKPLLEGADPLDHLSVLSDLSRFKGLHAAKALVDIALWDIRGKLFNQPVWRLLGGGPAKPVPLTWVAHGNDRDSQVAEACRMAEERGYSGMKLKAWKKSRDDLRLVEEVRKRLGDERVIYVDCNGSYSQTEARTILRHLEDFGVSFIEDPCRVSNPEHLREVARALPIAILGDSNCPTLDAVQIMVQAQAVGAVSVKLRRTGFTESLKIIALCEAVGIPAIIGTDSESRIGAQVRAHMRMSIPSMAAWPMETHFFDKLATDVFVGEFGFSNGTIKPGDEPGFGASFDRERIGQFVLQD